MDRDLGHDPAAEHHDGPVTCQLDLIEFRGVQEHGGSLLGELAQEAVDLVFGADIDATRRVEAEHRPDPAGDPTGDGHLLLVAAGQLPDLGRGARVDLERGRCVGNAALFVRDRDRAPRADRGGEGEGDVLPDRALHQEGLCPIRRHIHQAGADGIGRVAE